MYFASHEVVKERLEDLLKGTDVGKAVVGGCGGDCGDRPIPSHAHAYAASALAGGISGALAWLITYPFDVIKTQIQTSPMDGRYARGTWAVGYELVQRRGWRFMFRGLGVTLAGAVPVNAVIFPTSSTCCYSWRGNKSKSVLQFAVPSGKGSVHPKMHISWNNVSFVHKRLQ